MTLTRLENKRDVVKSFLLFLLVNVFQASAFCCLSNLQSSLNVEGGLGVTSLFVYAAVLVLCSLLGVPVVMRLLAPKTQMIISYSCTLIYVLLNFEQAFATLIPANIFLGAGRALYWTSSSSFLVFYAKAFQTFTNGNFGKYVSIINGCFFSAAQSGQIFGNLIPFAVFGSSLTNKNDANTTSDFAETTSGGLLQKHPEFSVSDICGAKDCQDSAATSENLSNYQPPNQTSYYIVMGVTTAMSVLSLMLFVFFMPSAKDDAIRNRENKFADSYANEAYLEENKECFNNNNNEDTDPNNNNVKKVSPAIEYQDYNKSEAGGDVDVKVDTSSTTSNIRKSFDMWIEEMRKTFKFFLTIHQCLLAPFQFHMGLTFSFAISEFTRAYVSCVYGLSQVGISMTFFGISSLIVAIIVGRVSSKVGSKPIIGATFIINCSEYIFLLVWVPKEDSSLAVLYGLALVSGVSIGILQTITSDEYMLKNSVLYRACCSSFP
ncbi:protein unc-93 homolog A-like isoform X2 [Clavelina lepadiformis]|uniref:protein unc-93 homolog A-like isoform X2 n=1 Tax=Clavelina lepadiformis TaxID=159417 RepID=UPI004041E969